MHCSDDFTKLILYYSYITNYSYALKLSENAKPNLPLLLSSLLVHSYPTFIALFFLNLDEVHYIYEIILRTKMN